MTAQTAPASIRRPLTLALLGIATLLLPACSAVDRIENIGKAPQLAGIEDPSRQPGYKPVHLPMPAPVLGEQKPNSLWRAGARAFFKDQRANKTGDILTVLIQINDKAQLNNQTTRGRDGSEAMDLPGLFGFQRNIARVLPTPDNNDLTNLLSTTSKSSTTGTGAIKRDEQIELKVAALITQVLPNGNMVIQGKQEVRVNYELRELTISGVIRPEDINAQNTIGYEKIAEARIAYGGRGQITDVQQPRYGQQLIDIIAPF
jgi:flagellar L-ring protein precursor FlgH